MRTVRYDEHEAHEAHDAHDERGGRGDRTMTETTDVALVLGESLVDVVRRGPETRSHPGGSAANVAVALARLDRPTWFATAYADDEDGRLVADHLSASGVRLATDPAAIERTSRAVATVREGGGATYDFDLEWRLHELALPDSARVLVAHAGSIGAALAPGAEQVHGHLALARSTATISFDVNARTSITGTGPEVTAQAEQMVGVSDVVKASDEDIAELWPGRTLEQAARDLLALGPQVVVVTRGGDGALWWSADASGEVAPVRTRVADTIGAGDTFSAGMLDALWERDLLGAERRTALSTAPWDEILTWAARAAAVTVSRPGADPPRRAELSA